MSNVVKKLKKNFRKIVKAVLIAAVAYVALPALASAVSGGAAAGAAGAAGTATGSFTAGASTVAATGGAAATGAAAAGTAAASSGGLLGAIGAGASKVGSVIAAADPMVKLGLIQTGGAMLQGAMTPEEQTAAEAEAERLALYQSQPRSVRTYSAGEAGLVGGSTSAGLAGGQAVQQTGYTNRFADSIAQTQASGGLVAPVARLNSETGMWERAS